MRYYSSTASAKTLDAAVTTSSTTVQLSDLDGLPASYPYTLVLDPDTTSEEIVTVTSIASGTVLNVKRGTEEVSTGVTGGDGTSKKDHSLGSAVKHMVTARDLQEPQTHIAATADVHGVSGTLSTVLAAKAPLASPTFTGTVTAASVTATGTVTLPTATSIGNVSSTELGYLDGVTSAVQTQLNNKAASTHTHAISDVTSLQTSLDSKLTSAYASLYTSSISFTTDATLSFANELFDSSSGHSTSSNPERFTATVAGKYALSCSVTILVGGQAGTFTVGFRKNTSTSNISGSSASAYLPTANTSQQTITATSMVELNGSTDYVTVYLDGPGSSGSPHTVTASWNIVYVGA